MIKLHGFPMSNYYNMVKAALLEKGIDFEDVAVRPSQDEGYLDKSPMGKVPYIETEDGYLSETQTILEYLEESGPGPSLLPSSSFERAKVRELMHGLELYVELPARTCYGPVFFGREASTEVLEMAKKNLEKGIRSVRRLARFGPFIAGASLTLADLFAIYSLPLANRVTKKLWQWDLLADLPGATEWSLMMYERAAMKTIHADQKSAS
jgi:glutathione S-transferase